MGKNRVADLVTKVLAEAGIWRIYGVPGDSLNGITDSIRERKDIQWIYVRDEETAAFAAGAEAAAWRAHEMRLAEQAIEELPTRRVAGRLDPHVRCIDAAKYL